MNSTTFRILGWAAPLACMGLACIASYSQYARLNAAGERKVSLQRDYDHAISALDVARKEVAGENRIATVPRIDAESTLFLNDLRLRAQRAGVDIVNWKTSTAPASTTDAQKDPARAQLLTGVDRVSSELTIEGEYAPIRAFIEDLTESSRLYTINNAQWNRRETGGTQLMITVSRYVTEPVARTEARP